MSTPIDPTKLDVCGCCPGETEKEPHFNSPGQAALRYRVGIQPTFLERMLERIHQWEVLTCKKCDRTFIGPDRAEEIRAHLAESHGLSGAAAENEIISSRPLASLTTRATDDPAIALMDAWAMVADVLTFYQERIANEGFLRTAIERRSILELARAIGYELDPGVAAEAWLAFKVDDSEGAPTTAVVSKGTPVQSIPARDGEVPQTFQTKEELQAHVRWNAMRPRLAHPQSLEAWMTHVYLSGTGLGLEKGDLVLLVAGGGQDPRKIRRIEEDTETQRTKIEIEFDPKLAEPPTAVDAKPEAELDPDQEPLELTSDDVREQIYEKTWDEPGLQAFLAHHEWDADDVLVYVDELRAQELEGSGELHALRERVAFFGHNAPRHASLPQEITTTSTSKSATSIGGQIQAFDQDSGSTSPWPVDWDAENLSIWRDSLTGDYYDAGKDEHFDVYLERPVENLGQGTWVVFERPLGKFATFIINSAAEASRAGYGMSAKATGLELCDSSDGSLASNDIEKLDDFKFRTSVAHLKSEELELAAIPLTADDAKRADVAKGTVELWLGSMVLGLREGQRVALQGEEVDTDGKIRHEILTLAEVIHSAGLTRLQLESPGLAYAYKRDTISINANVTLASHGETVAGEVLGSGDGSAGHQSFELKKPPLTYVAVGTASGSESTLTVRVDGVEWSETSSLYFLGPDSKSYVIRTDDDANARVIFGDGKKGARLPTGAENVVAEYRSGMGLEGEVGAGSLSLLKKRPFGIRAVTNPFPAGGADDPEVFEDAKANAPLTVLTLDRIVSLQDYEDFARAYPGIGKARAVSVWDGESEVVHITVADSSGDEVVSPLSGYLRDAIDDARDPLRKVELASFQPLSFFVSAKVLIDEAYLWEDVKTDMETALLGAFGFEERAFGQPVAAADVMQVMHATEGVVAVDLDWLDKTQAPEGAPSTSFNAVLDAQVARFDKEPPDGPRILPAQLLLIHPLGIDLTEMTP